MALRHVKKSFHQRKSIDFTENFLFIVIDKQLVIKKSPQSFCQLRGFVDIF